MSDHSSGDERRAGSEDSYAKKKRDDRKEKSSSRRDDRERDRSGYESDNIKRRHHRLDSDDYGDYRSSRRDTRYDDDDDYSLRSRSRSRSRSTGRSRSRTRSRSRSRQRELERREEEPRVSGDELGAGSDRGDKEKPKENSGNWERVGGKGRGGRAKENTQRKNGWGQKGRTYEPYDNNRGHGSGHENRSHGGGYDNRGLSGMDGPREPWKPDISAELVNTPSNIFQGCNFHICKTGFPKLPINTLDLVKTHGGKLCPDPSARHCNYVVIPLGTNLPANTVLPIDRHLPSSQWPVHTGDQRPGVGWYIEGLVRFFSRVVGPVPPDEQRKPRIVLRQEWLVDCVRVGRILGEEDGWAGWEVKSTYDPKLVFTASPHPVSKDNRYEPSPHHSGGGGPSDLASRVNGGGARMSGDYQRRDSGMRKNDMGSGRDDDGGTWRNAGESSVPPEFFEKGDANPESYQSPSVTPSLAARIQPPVVKDEPALSSKFTPIASLQRVDPPTAPVPDYSYPNPAPLGPAPPTAEPPSTFRPSATISSTPSRYAPAAPIPIASYTPTPVRPVQPAVNSTTLPPAARLFSVSGLVAMTFCVEGPPMSRKTTEMLITRTGGGVIAHRDRAMFTVLPIAKDQPVVEPEFLAILDELATDPTRAVISQDWLMECIEAEVLVPIADYVAQAATEVPAAAPTTVPAAVPAVPISVTETAPVDSVGQKRRAEEELRERVKRSMLERQNSEEKSSTVPSRSLGGALDLRGVQEAHYVAMEAVIQRLRSWQLESGWDSLLEVLGISSEPVETEHQLRYVDDLFLRYGKELALNVPNLDIPSLMTLWKQNMPSLS
ncbi:hypothetical protein IAT38_005887 [Cryptococcus sp. DSM 104549]